MKQIFAAVVFFAILIYLLRNEKAPLAKPKVENFEPELIQNTINNIQETDKNLYPIETVYFNKNDSDNTYQGRFIFLNTDGFFGVQYDVVTDGMKNTTITKSIPPEYSGPFSGFAVKQSFGDLKKTTMAPAVDMAKVHEKFKVVPPIIEEKYRIAVI